MYLEADSEAVSAIDISFVNVFYEWIEYNAAGVLNVTISNSSIKPPKPLISESIDLTGVLNDFMYVGFTSGTNVFNDTTQDVYNEVYTWSFETGEDPATNPDHGESEIVIPIVVSVSVLVALLLIAIALWYFPCHRKRKEIVERSKAFQMTELDALPDHSYGAHNFKYKDLNDPTGKFS